MRIWIILLALISTSYSASLYHMKSSAISGFANGANMSFEVKRYLLINDDSTYQTASFPVNGFGSLVSAIASDSGALIISADSIQFKSIKCALMKGECEKPMTEPKFQFLNGTLTDPAFELSKNIKDTTIIRKVKNGFKEVDSQKSTGNSATILGIGILAVLGLLILAK